jgi:hypothetical protein
MYISKTRNKIAKKLALFESEELYHVPGGQDKDERQLVSRYNT